MSDATGRALERADEESSLAEAALLHAAVATKGEHTLDAVAERVALSLCEAEAPARRAELAERFAGLIRARRFLPSVPILSNAGVEGRGQLAACFVLEMEDSLESIYATLGRAAAIQQASGGVGIDFSGLRARGSPIHTSGGVSPGPLAFVELFAHSARVNALAGRRPGAHLAVLRDDHPDVLELVRAAARDRREIAGVGLALGVRSALLAAAERDADHGLRDDAGRTVGSISARELLSEIARAIHASGEPTLLCLDHIAAANPVPQLGEICATNPCGEQPLLPGESCVLGSLALPAFADEGGALDLGALSSAVRDGVRLLDDTVEVTRPPDAACAAASLRTRKIGLGVLGFASLLLRRGVAYDSPAALALADEIGALLREESQRASESLAAERGAFPAWRGPGAPRRNATTLAIAPTGTIRLLARASGGIEPLLEPVVRVRAGARELRWVERDVLAWLAANARSPELVLEGLAAGAPLAAIPGLDDRARSLLRRGFEIPPEAQLAVQARLQHYVDGAVSKTVHLAEDASAARIAELISLAHTLACKGAAFWRRRSAAESTCIECSP